LRIQPVESGFNGVALRETAHADVVCCSAGIAHAGSAHVHFTSPPQNEDLDSTAIDGRRAQIVLRSYSCSICRTVKERSAIMATATLDWSQCPAVESIPGKVSGAWVFRDTRLPVATVIENLEDLSVEEVME
jgi:hypothetical protein